MQRILISLFIASVVSFAHAQSENRPGVGGTTHKAVELRDAGRVDALVVSSPKRRSLMPNLPATVKAGFADSDCNFWVGALAAAKSPHPIV